MSGKIAGTGRAQRQEASLLKPEPLDRSRGIPRAAALLQRSLGWAAPATPQERAAALWSFAYFFMLLAGYYVLRPLRDRMGIAGGVNALPWMFTATFVTLLVMQPLYGALVAKLPRARFIAIVYHFFAANLALFWLLLTLGVAPVIVARVFFVWVSVFNLFAVAVFWSFMADLFDSEQGRRLFGFIGAGGTAGSLLGPAITIGLSAPLGPVNLLTPPSCSLNSRCSASTGSSARPTPAEVRARNRRASAAAPSPGCPSCSARPICSASAPGSACCLSARPFSISSRPTSSPRPSTAPARRRASSPASTWRSGS